MSDALREEVGGRRREVAEAREEEMTALAIECRRAGVKRIGGELLARAADEVVAPEHAEAIGCRARMDEGGGVGGPCHFHRLRPFIAADGFDRSRRNVDDVDRAALIVKRELLRVGRPERTEPKAAAEAGELRCRSRREIADVELVFTAHVRRVGDRTAIGTERRFALEHAARRRQIARPRGGRREPEIAARFEEQRPAIGGELPRRDETGGIDVAMGGWTEARRDFDLHRR
jgi:hypothetical protein